MHYISNIFTIAIPGKYNLNFREIPVSSCGRKVVHVPTQERAHRKKCLLPDTHKGTVVFQTDTKKLLTFQIERAWVPKNGQTWLDKPARLSFSCSLDLLLNDIHQTNINRDIRDGNWLSNPGV